MNNPATIVDQLVIPHTAFVEAERQIRQCFEFSVDKSTAQGLAIVGESGAGKTTVLDSFRSQYEPTHDSEGWQIPILSATVPPKPTIGSLAGTMLAALKDPLWTDGTEHHKSKRLRVLMGRTKTRMVMIDEFQHFYDQDKRKMMYNVADWLKVLIDDTHAILVVAGLSDCISVISQNEQLRRRFQSPLQLPRFRWEHLAQRREFRGIMKGFYEQISPKYELPALHSDEMAFRFYCATGGLIGYVSNLLRKAVRNAADDNKKSITIEDLNVAHLQAIYSVEAIEDRLKPFANTFSLVPDGATLDRAGKIGAISNMPASATSRRSRKPKPESLDSILRKS